jgi:hypothetical protein
MASNQSELLTCYFRANKGSFKSMKVLESGKRQMGESAAKVGLFKVQTFCQFKCRVNWTAIASDQIELLACYLIANGGGIAVNLPTKVLDSEKG